MRLHDFRSVSGGLIRLFQQRLPRQCLHRAWMGICDDCGVCVRDLVVYRLLRRRLAEVVVQRCLMVQEQRQRPLAHWMGNGVCHNACPPGACVCCLPGQSAHAQGLLAVSARLGGLPLISGRRSSSRQQRRLLQGGRCAQDVHHHHHRQAWNPRCGYNNRYLCRKWFDLHWEHHGIGHGVDEAAVVAADLPPHG